MKLKTITYSQFKGKPQEWTIHGLTLGPINLLVGRNAIGKTRTLNIINGLSKLLCTDEVIHYLSGEYHVVFEHDDLRYEYKVEYSNSKILKEEFSRNGKKLVGRGKGGVGTIYAEKIDRWLDFKSPENKIAVVTKRDLIQHPFLELLYEWANSVYFYPFSSGMGKESFAIAGKGQKVEVPFDPRDYERVVAIYNRGEKNFGDKFKKMIFRDMKELGYPIKDIGLKLPSSLIIKGRGTPPGELLGLYVKEISLRGFTDQADMSRGMFRALSIIIQLNYSRMALKPSCILIDDIGEGLDFKRSKSLIELVVQKINGSSTQLIMATNDRFIMNAVPLEAWTVLHRKGQKIVVSNYENSREAFKEFKFTGLSNFEFFAADFIHESQPKK